MLLFNEPEKAISSESKAVENKENELKKLIDDVAKDLQQQPLSVNIPQTTNTTFKGENSDSNASPQGSNLPHKKRTFHHRGRIPLCLSLLNYPMIKMYHLPQ